MQRRVGAGLAQVSGHGAQLLMQPAVHGCKVVRSRRDTGPQRSCVGQQVANQVLDDGVDRRSVAQTGQQTTDTRLSFTPLQLVVQYGSGWALTGAPRPGVAVATAPVQFSTCHVAEQVYPAGLVTM